jgi:hypothetical protein
MDWLPTLEKKRKLDTSMAAASATASPQPSSTTGGSSADKKGGNSTDAAMKRQVVLLSKQVSTLMSIVTYSWNLPPASSTVETMKAATTAYANTVKESGSSKTHGQPYQWAFGGLIRGLMEDPQVPEKSREMYQQISKQLTREKIQVYVSSCRTYTLKNKSHVIQWSPGISHSVGEQEALDLHRLLVETMQNYPEAMMFSGPAPKNGDVRTIESSLKKK